MEREIDWTEVSDGRFYITPYRQDDDFYGQFYERL